MCGVSYGMCLNTFFLLRIHTHTHHETRDLRISVEDVRVLFLVSFFGLTRHMIYLKDVCVLTLQFRFCDFEIVEFLIRNLTLWQLIHYLVAAMVADRS